MPLRDHFHPPLTDAHSWDALHGGWPMMIVQSLFGKLPRGYIAGPQVHFSGSFEVDVGTFEKDDPDSPAGGAGGVGVATWAPARPTVAVQADLPRVHDYEVRVYDMERGRTLVAVIEIVSPSNKGSPDRRLEFVGKCVSLLRQRVSVIIVDIVTSYHFNLYADLLAQLGERDPTLGDDPPATYAVACRWLKPKRKPGVLEAWSHPLFIGQALPVLPLWLSPTLAIKLELEQSYEDTCRVLYIP
jgi:hypothetical protein